uniref:Organic solute transporter alpha-like protein n=1 Tax=Timema tahoe TaxID=61484 RepID=A0A7R9IF90_9NEOP|nr:unnamed protein product [Timema tahoe]
MNTKKIKLNAGWLACVLVVGQYTSRGSAVADIPTLSTAGPREEVYDRPTINVAGITLFTMGGAAVVLILLLYVDTLRHIMRNAPPLVKTHSAFVLSVYPGTDNNAISSALRRFFNATWIPHFTPRLFYLCLCADCLHEVVAMATYCAIIVPRAQLLAEAVTQGVFMASLYQLFCLLVAYCGGEAELIRRVKPNSLNLRVGPCCCWPCCCLPQVTVNKEHVRKLRMLILQLPVVQGLVYMILMVMWAEEEVNYMYLQPVVVLSILFGIWGISMTIKMLAEVLKDHHMQGKFLVLQFVLLLAKMQGLVFRILVWASLLPCRPPITPTVYANCKFMVCLEVIYNSLMLAEMVILGIVARLLYRKELPDLDFIESRTQPQQVYAVGDICIASPEKILASQEHKTAMEQDNNNVA